MIHRALAKRPEDRFTSAADFASAMQHVLQGAGQLPAHLTTTDLSQLPTGQFSQAQAAEALRAGPQSPAASSGAASGSKSSSPTRPEQAASASVRRPQRASVGLLIGVALAFLLLGVGLAVGLMKFVVK